VKKKKAEKIFVLKKSKPGKTFVFRSALGFPAHFNVFTFKIAKSSA